MKCSIKKDGHGFYHANIIIYNPEDKIRALTQQYDLKNTPFHGIWGYCDLNRSTYYEDAIKYFKHGIVTKIILDNERGFDDFHRFANYFCMPPEELLMHERKEFIFTEKEVLRYLRGRELSIFRSIVDSGLSYQATANKIDLSRTRVSQIFYKVSRKLYYLTKKEITWGIPS